MATFSLFLAFLLTSFTSLTQANESIRDISPYPTSAQCCSYSINPLGYEDDSVQRYDYYWVATRRQPHEQPVVPNLRRQILKPQKPLYIIPQMQRFMKYTSDMNKKFAQKVGKTLSKTSL